MMPLSLPIILAAGFKFAIRSRRAKAASRLRSGGGFQIARPKTDPGMSDRCRQRIRRIRSLRAASGEKISHHHRNLRFFRKAGKRRNSERYPARLTEL